MLYASSWKYNSKSVRICNNNKEKKVSIVITKDFLSISLLFQARQKNIQSVLALHTSLRVPRTHQE